LVSTGEKKLTTVAEAMCDVTRLRGITEIRMVDHSLNPKMKARVAKIIISFSSHHDDGQSRPTQPVMNPDFKSTLWLTFSMIIPSGGTRRKSDPNVLPLQGGPGFKDQLFPAQRPDCR